MRIRRYWVLVLGLAAVNVVVASRLRNVGLACRVGLGAEVSGGGAGLGEVAREDGLEERAEDDLSAARNMSVLH